MICANFLLIRIPLGYSFSRRILASPGGMESEERLVRSDWWHLPVASRALTAHCVAHLATHPPEHPLVASCWRIACPPRLRPLRLRWCCFVSPVRFHTRISPTPASLVFTWKSVHPNPLQKFSSPKSSLKISSICN